MAPVYHATHVASHSYAIADLAGSETITAPHVAEALQYRARGEAG